MVTPPPGYRFDRLIHDGPRSLVYQGHRLEDELAVIIKVNRHDYPTFAGISQFCNQYFLTKSIDLPGVVRALDLVSHKNSFALVLEDRNALSLPAYLGDRRLDAVHLLKIAIELAEILAGLYARFIIHKDIKPANILIEPSSGHVLLTDFSVATLLPRESEATLRSGALEGTLAYMSPEQTGKMNRGVDHRSDYYSLGITLYELATGKLPFRAEDPLDLLYDHIARRPLPPAEAASGVPRALSDITMKLLEKDPEARYQTADGIRHDLERCLELLLETGEAPSFPLGQGDVLDRFMLPEKLYGREMEIQRLMDAFDRASQGATEVVLVVGSSGIGKSALVNEVHTPITRQHGYFAAGKFDQYKRDVPFASVARAFRDLLKRVLEESEERVAIWNEKLSKALGKEGRVITDLIPEVTLLIGEQPPVPELPPADNQDRLHKLFQRFIGVFATQDHPLVLFLDDLQWADSASLALIHALVTDKETRGLLLIGAYRDNEVESAHPLRRTLDRIAQERAALMQIVLPPLGLAHITQLVSDALRCPHDEAESLARLVLKKTLGNPFFCSQYLLSLHREGILSFDRGLRRFRCDLVRAQKLSESSDVVVFMIDQLKGMAADTQRALSLASAIGDRFDLDTLAIALEVDKATAAEALWPVLKAGLVVPLHKGYKAYQGSSAEPTPATTTGIVYKFLHDRVQQAAYCLIAEDERPSVHLRLGRLLLANAGPHELEEQLFDIVNQFEAGAALIVDPAEKRKVAELDLQAGRKAKASTAYAPAARILAAGMALLTEAAWENDYDLMLALHKERAGVESLEGHFETSESLILTAVERARTALDKAELYLLLVMQNTLRAEYQAAIETGRAALRLLGVELPERDFTAARDADMAGIDAAIAGRPIATLYDMSEMREPDQIMAMRLLIAMGPPTYRSHQALWSVIVTKAVSLCVTHGNVPQTAYCYTGYGGLLGYVRNDYKSGAAFGEVALRLAQRYNSPSDSSVAFLMEGSSVRHWTKHLRHASEDYHRAVDVGIHSGNLQYAAYAFGHNMYCLFYQGVSIDEVGNAIANAIGFSRRRKNQWAIDMLEGGELVLACLKGQTRAPNEFSTRSRSEATYLEGAHAHRNDQVVCVYNALTSHVLYIHGALEEARERARLSEQAIASVATQGLLPWPEQVFTRTLIEIALGKEGDGAAWRRRIAESQEQMRIWAENAPDNFLHQHLLLEAEAARIDGRLAEAEDFYDAAIEAARTGSFTHNAALAAELAARFWFERGKERFARIYLADAYYGYLSWGALAKVRLLEETYPHLLSGAERSSTMGRVTATESLGGEATRASLELGNVVKALQAISAEIELGKLLATLFRITMESAGAERGFILLPKGNEWFIEASGTAMEGQATLLGRIPIEESKELCAAVVYEVARGGEAIVLDDATARGPFTQNPYIVRTKPRSMACLPAYNHGKLVAIAYLENNLAAGCFTANELEIVRLLLTQAAIAVDNALLYEDVRRAQAEAHQAKERLEIEVAERTQALRVANERLQEEFHEREEAEEARRKLQEEIIRVQDARLLELSTPLIPITDEVMVMPLIGTMDAARATRVLETALFGAKEQRARVVILDVTGMSHLDESSAGVLLRTASALRLLGTETVLTGVRPEVAAMLVSLGLDLQTLVLQGTLQSGIAYALARSRSGSRATLHTALARR